MRCSERAAVCILMLLTAPPGTSQAATNEATATVTLKVTWVMPPCEVTGPGTIQLGNMTPGRQSHAAFDLTVTCPLSSVAHLYAGAGRSQRLVSGSPSRVLMTNVAGRPGQPAQFWLTTGGGAEVALDGGGATDSAKRFCTGTTTGNSGSRTCSLTPWTQVFPGAPTGLTTAWVTFTVLMP